MPEGLTIIVKRPNHTLPEDLTIHCQKAISYTVIRSYHTLSEGHTIHYQKVIPHNVRSYHILEGHTIHCQKVTPYTTKKAKPPFMVRNNSIQGVVKDQFHGIRCIWHMMSAPMTL